jgi:hypothetical protein
MHKFVLVVVSACALAGCTVREQQVLTAGAVGAVAGAVIVNEMNQPRPVYVEQPYQRYYVPVPPRRPRCYMTWENTRRGYVERRVCDNHIP